MPAPMRAPMSGPSGVNAPAIPPSVAPPRMNFPPWTRPHFFSAMPRPVTRAPASSLAQRYPTFVKSCFPNHFSTGISTPCLPVKNFTMSFQSSTSAFRRL